MKKFGLIGAAGYVAVKHLKAIKETDNELIAALDKNDSVGILDSYFPKTSFFTEFERFDRHLDKLKRVNEGIDYLAICSPNYLHDAHIRLGLRSGANVICEKPLVLNPWNIDSIIQLETETGLKVNNILQLRLHPVFVKLKNEFRKTDKIVDIDLTYITSRGNWYYTSWKGDITKSGGVVTNIGIHFFDVLSWIYGDVVENTVHLHEHDRASGVLRLQNANIRWFLSINEDHLPKEKKEKGERVFRNISIDGKEVEFTQGFTDLHTESYHQILEGKGFTCVESQKSIGIVHQIRNSEKSSISGDYHPLTKFPLSKHPIFR